MHENSKALPLRHSGFRFDDAEGGESRNAEDPQIAGSIEQGPNQRAMEYFGKAVAELFECNSCYVAVMSRTSESELKEVRIGHATVDPSCSDTVARIARKGAGTDCALLEPVNARTTFVRKLIGPEPGINSHSVIGRFASRDRSTVVFVAGWRQAALARAEIPCLARAVRTVWETAHSLAQRSSDRHLDAEIWLEKLAFPALVVDEGLHVHGINHGGQALLAKGELLKIDGGRLAGNGPVTESLREAIREALVPRPGQVWLNTTVPLSTERQQFAFAKIGAAPTHWDAGKALIVVPQFDEALGAHRIASAFGLNWAEERIIAKILQFQCPRDIGADLRLTEATVRTYTKRIMLKLGINRQAEFFLLYHLTQSPFGAGGREKAVCPVSSDCRLIWTAGKRPPN
ncbi:helix-turn-helix transcriptional regulator [Bradyrhizobium sp. CSA112]|uniref:helix-turn-helix transcriptional regulator n=1 Tax=Bradyrhizobium sp. CSA112 TaxID=2699170 RepID=UPI0023B0FCD4|nr:helix-turn-helix transcriptional regulator [Bradyrhizobium sp. CSA112]MDE5458466.1 helix-turn-helix transcriptional regulator [Bradyrhizobium sp. CSA112]